MKKSILVFAIFFSMAIVFTSCKESKKEVEVEQIELGVEKADMAMNDIYLCPMGCEKDKTYDKEGTCPVCNMILKKVEKGEGDEMEHGDHEH